ncbi:MAG TPA: YbdD/YjiX family protein [Burkholderiales bacterium]
MREPESADLNGVFPRLRAAWLGVFGIPNYDAYVAHMRATHPGEAPLERGEFLAWALERRYAGRRPRCC